MELETLLAVGMVAAASADDAVWAGPSRVPAGWSQEKLTRAPNVLLVTADQHRWDWLSAEGHPVVETPNLDRLAAMGMRLNRAFCQSPACMPSRASFLTGRYPHFTGVLRNGGALPVDQYRHLLSRRLSDAGYYTGLAGKLHLRQPEFPGSGDQCVWPPGESWL
jgi:arylsulfatase A-like enzyme